MDSFETLFMESQDSKKEDSDEKSKFTQISMENENLLTA